MEKSLGRKEIVSILYKTAYLFFRILKFRKFREAHVTLKEVFLSPSLRVDILDISWSDQVTIMELKTCKEDFKHDEKWQKYMDYCDYFWFMCPVGAIDKSVLPKEVGLVYVNLDSKKPYFTIVKQAERLRPTKIDSIWFKKIYKKLAFRQNHDKLIEETDELFSKNDEKGSII